MQDQTSALSFAERGQIKPYPDIAKDHRQAVCQRIYPADPKSIGVVLFAEGGDVQLKSLEAWEMVPTNQW